MAVCGWQISSAGGSLSSLKWRETGVRNLYRGELGGRRIGWKSRVNVHVPVLKATVNITCQNVDSPQNVDLPAVYPKKKKKPFVTPIKVQKKRRYPGIERFLKPPANGMIVPKLIPVAHTVMRAKRICEKGVSRLVQVIPVKTCRFCTDVHIGPVGHSLRTCRGPKSSSRQGRHDWLKGSADDILVPVEAYHLEDRLGAPVSHDLRFDVQRISAVEELCIQAGYESPRYPTKRYNEPLVPEHQKKVEEGNWTGEVYDPSYTVKETNTKKAAHPLDDTGWTEVSMPEDISREERIVEVSIDEQNSGGMPSQASGSASRAEVETPELGAELLEIDAEDDLATVAEKTLIAWEVLREGARRLMTKYRVVACGYCPEVHVGPRGHRARNCGAFKHQWRDGKHGWQEAAMDELIPSQYVWHLRDKNGPPLESALQRFYGKSPAIVELCIQANAVIPSKYKALMRLDIAIPTVDELELVV